MGRLRAISIVLVLAAVAAATLSACGSSDEPDLLPGETASEINANLDLVETLVGEGDCVGAANAAAAVREQVEGLTGVNKELKEALTAGANRLNEVIVECDEAASEEEDTTETVEPDEEEREADEEREQEKADKEAEKEAEKEQKAEEKSEKETPPVEPPGQEKKEEKEAPPTEPEDGGTPSGGVAPSVQAGTE
jgi:septal ring-binding cell division protein DamX